MLFYVTTLLLIFCPNSAYSFTPNCVRENQFKFFPLVVHACSENFAGKCRLRSLSTFQPLGDASLVKLFKTDIVPTCAFANIDTLKHIYGVNSGIKVLAGGAFINLPNLESINMAFNSIRDLRRGVFENVSVEFVDFSWNDIVFIDANAFSEVHNLKSLNLSRNSLVTVPISAFPSTLTYLNLQHNLLTRIALNTHKYTNLTVVDLSNNTLERIALFSSYPLDRIDCGSNKLENFDYIDLVSVGTFSIGKNRFQKMPNFVENLNAKQIDLYPNPWKCNELRQFWGVLSNFNSRLVSKKPGATHQECFVKGTKPGVTPNKPKNCQDDHDCPSHMACRSKKCWDICSNALCHKTSVCTAKKHRFKCSCPKKLFADPMDVEQKCQRVDCFISSHCPRPLSCLENKCLKLNLPPAIDTIIYPEPPDIPWWFDEIPSHTPPH